MNLTADILEAAWQPYASVSFSPPTVFCGPVSTPVGVSITNAVKGPVAPMTVRVTGVIDGDGEPVCESTAQAVIDVVIGATLSRDPTSVPARHSCATVPEWGYSDLIVEWNPPIAGCDGILLIDRMEPAGPSGYLPEHPGTLMQQDTTHWRYTSLWEPAEALHPEPVRVWIAAWQGTTTWQEKVAETSILVLPVHFWWTHNHQMGPGQPTQPPTTTDFQNDYLYITCKYAAVLATTGGAFASVQISADNCVHCPVWNPLSPCGYACTEIDDDVFFGTSAFTGSENQAASIVGHELAHTVGPANQNECSAYTWEELHQNETGIDQDPGYLQDVEQHQDQECPP